MVPFRSNVKLRFDPLHSLKRQRQRPAARHRAYVFGSKRPTAVSRLHRTLGVMKIIAISGSLRVASINSAFCRVARQLSPAALEISLFTGIGDLPLFNPDLELNPPSPVRKFRAAVDDSSALIIASPEYAHGISGPMKNAGSRSSRSRSARQGPTTTARSAAPG